MVRIGSDWTRSDQIRPDWTRLDQSIINLDINYQKLPNDPPVEHVSLLS